MVRRTRFGKKKVWLILLLILVTTGVVFGLLWYFNPKDENNEGTTDEVVVREDNVAMIESSDDMEVEELEVSDDVVQKVVQYEGDDPNASEELSGVITYADVSDGILRVRLNIDQFLSGGTCDLRILDESGVIYTESVAIVDSVATSTCEGFDVKQSEIGVGDFRVEVLIESGGKSGKIEGEVSL